ncbi:MAG: hypothetical protein AB1348_09060 [Nitrospirota bacterium]
MNYQFRALQLSFILHALVFLIIIGISNSIIPTSKLIVIDFAIEDSQRSGVKSQESNTRPQTTESRSQRSENKSRRLKIKNRR